VQESSLLRLNGNFLFDVIHVTVANDLMEGKASRGLMTVCDQRMNDGDCT
jgi:hypothetical protein